MLWAGFCHQSHSLYCKILNPLLGSVTASARTLQGAEKLLQGQASEGSAFLNAPKAAPLCSLPTREPAVDSQLTTVRGLAAHIAASTMFNPGYIYLFFFSIKRFIFWVHHAVCGIFVL